MSFLAAVGPGGRDLPLTLAAGEVHRVHLDVRGLRVVATAEVGLFRSPSGHTAGIMSGCLYNLDEVLAPVDPGLAPELRLGEALEQLLRRHGPVFARSLDGAFAIVVAHGDRVIATRDAIGEVPLYALPAAGVTLLSDRMMPLLAHPLCARRVDPGGVVDYLACGFAPFTRTVAAGIERLAPGVAREIEAGGTRDHAWHELGGSPVADNLEAATAALRTALDRAVARRRVAGARDGLLLSGGLDSSLVGALVGGGLASSFSIAFGDEHRNELEHSAVMARHLGIAQHVVTITAADVMTRFNDTMRVIDEPIGDALTVPNVLVAEAARSEVDVVWNGEGGDPLFGGPKNLPLLAHLAYASFSARPPETTYLAAYQKGYPEVLGDLNPDFAAAYADGAASEAMLRPHLEVALPSYLDRLMHANLRLKGAGQILPKVHMVASSLGLRVRSPLFDRQLAELAFRLPSELKLQGSREKHVLKEAVRDVVPESIRERPKSGMLVPVNAWFRGPLSTWARELLLGRDARLMAVMRRDRVERLLRFQGGGGRGFHGQRIWLLVTLEAWLRCHGVSA